MTAGSGILHEEMPKKPEEGIMEGFQLWVNLPASLKMIEPRYRGLTSHKSLKLSVMMESQSRSSRVNLGESKVLLRKYSLIPPI